jgi:hypothetical protein
VRFFEVDELPVSAIGRDATSWGGGKPRPYSWAETFCKGTEIGAMEFSRRLKFEFELRERCPEWRQLRAA